MIGTVLALALAGCAGGSRTARAPSKPSAGEIYGHGEARYAAGAYDEAVQLWRHAVLELPQTAAYDELRHKLVCRMAYGQLMSWNASRDPGYLTDAKVMLDRYLERHESLHGDSESATKQRGDIYELLYQVESRLPAQSEAVGAGAEAEGEEVAFAEAATSSESFDETAPRAAPEDAESWSDDEDSDEVRTIVVRRQPSVDDPEIRRRLNHPLYNPFNLNGLGAPEMVVYHGPRAMVRRGLARANGDVSARREGRRAASFAMDAARPEIAECFAAAHARQPGAVSRTMLSFSVEPDGSISEAMIADGQVVDTLGDLCVIEALENATVRSEVVAARREVAIPITMWMTGTMLMDEWGGGVQPAGHWSMPFNGPLPYKNPSLPAGPEDAPNGLPRFK
ncbi:MAG: hypothetical protein AAF799_44920 [Myxococcota bacterium]